jgi:pimeloyl-ACP methyl ester carboxylesterase
MGSIRLYLAPLLVLIVGCANPSTRRDVDGPPFTDLSPVDRAGMEVTGFLRPEKLADRAGIYVNEPYQPGKVPILFVHGFISTPATWAPLFEQLQADTALREHCQFWFYYYPTGVPYIVSAADLRERLTLIREKLDPQHQDKALDNIVVVGHSMGGLVAKLLTVEGGPEFWQLVCNQPIESLSMKPQTRMELERIFFFRQQPMVRRVVFLASPHHGAKISTLPPAKIASSLVQLPKSLTEAARDVTGHNPTAEFRFASNKVPNSLRLLTPGDPSLELLASRPKPANVHFHSIVALGQAGGAERVLSLGSPPPNSDGVVTYASAHLEGVDSECVVSSDHTHMKSCPQTVQEIRRILRDHLRECGIADLP